MVRGMLRIGVSVSHLIVVSMLRRVVPVLPWVMSVLLSLFPFYGPTEGLPSPVSLLADIPARVDFPS